MYSLTENISTRTANQIKLCTNKVEWSIFNPNINIEYYNSNEPISVSIGSKKCETIVPVSVKYVGTSNDCQLNYFDSGVHTAIVALLLAGNKCISPSMIFRVLSGNKKGTRVSRITGSEDNTNIRISEKNYNYIIESINRMCSTEIEIGNSEISDKFYYSGLLLPCKIGSAVLNGHKSQNCIYFDFDEEELPPLFRYANTLNQIETLDVNMLDVDVISNYENTILKIYLLRRILACKKSIKMSNTIKLETVYNQLLNIDNKFSGSNLNHKRTRIINTIKSCMYCWKNKNLINGYEDKKSGNQLTSIVFSL